MGGALKALFLRELRLSRRIGGGAAMGVVFFLISLLMDNTLAMRTELIETARTLGATRRQILWKIVLPASLPAYLDTLRQMLAVGWTYLVVAEIVATTDGIGAMMMRAKRFVIRIIFLHKISAIQ